MAQVPMPLAVERSPIGHLAEELGYFDTSMVLETGDAARCLTAAPGRLTIGPRSEIPETVPYYEVNGDTITLTGRGTDQVWPIGTEVSRVIAAADLNGLIANVEDHESRFVAKPTAAGQIPIGHADGTITQATITAGANVTVTNADGSITIAAAGSEGDGATVITEGYPGVDVSAGTWVYTTSPGPEDLPVWRPLVVNGALHDTFREGGVGITLDAGVAYSTKIRVQNFGMVHKTGVGSAHIGMGMYLTFNGDLVEFNGVPATAEEIRVGLFLGYSVGADDLFLCPHPSTADRLRQLMDVSLWEPSYGQILGIGLGGQWVNRDMVAGPGISITQTEDQKISIGSHAPGAPTLLPGQCSTSIAVGSVVHAQPQVMGTFLNWEQAEPTSVSQLTIVGIVQATGTSASVAVSGIIPIPETSICPGYPVWLGAGGTLSDTSTGDVPKFLGWVVDSTHLYWYPQN